MQDSIVDLVHRYLTGEISIDALEEWEAARFAFFAALPN